MSERPRLLILSLSPLASDARVLKQIRGFARQYEVTTCGFGPAPHPGVTHLEVTRAGSAKSTRVRRYLTESLAVLRTYRRLYWSNADAQEADALLRGRTFDAVLSNDIDTVPIAMRHAPASTVHVDLHEYWPKLREDNARWMRFRSPYYSWLCRSHVARAASVTTVSPGIAAEYTRRFGFATEVVLNASPAQELDPDPVELPIRLVFSGAADPARGLETIIRAVAMTSTDLTLDLLLVPGPPGYLESIRDIAEQAHGRVTVRPPLPYDELVRALNTYDVGVYLPSGQGFNYTHSLPNKLFDFAQARLGVIVGPSPEMARVVREEGLGTVTAGHGVVDLVAVLDRLSTADVSAWKRHAHAAAPKLSAERQQHVWEDAIWRILRSGADATRMGH